MKQPIIEIMNTLGFELTQEQEIGKSTLLTFNAAGNVYPTIVSIRGETYSVYAKNHQMEKVLAYHLKGGQD